MTVQQMLDELSDHGFDDASAARQLAVVNDALWDACAREPWPFLVKTVSLTFTGSALTSATAPTDFRAATAMVITAGAGLGNSVKYIRRDDWLVRYGSITAVAGIPQMFYFVGNEMRFYPQPSSDCTIQMDYLMQPAAMAATDAEATVVIPVAFHRSVIVNGALFKLYAMEDDTDIAPTFETYYERGIVNMREYCWRRQYVTQDIIHPTDSDDLGLDLGWGNVWAG